MLCLQCLALSALDALVVFLSEHHAQSLIGGQCPRNMATRVANDDNQAEHLLVLDTMVLLSPLLAPSCLLVPLKGDGIPSDGQLVGHGLPDFS